MKKNHPSPVTVRRAHRPELGRGTRHPSRSGEEGLALLTVVLLLMIMTVLGIAAITTTSLENRMAGFTRTGEAAAGSAESCVGTAVNIIQQTIDAGTLPAAFLDNAVPAGPVPQAHRPDFQAEILGHALI